MFIEIDLTKSNYIQILHFQITEIVDQGLICHFKL